MDSAISRFASRTPFTQSLPFSSVMAGMGWACVIVGGAIVVVREGARGVVAKSQRPKTLDVAALQALGTQAGTSSILLEPHPGATLITSAGTRHSLRYGTLDERLNYAAELTAAGLTPVGRAFAHTKTRVLDLAHGFDGAMAGFSASTRRNARRGRDDATFRYTCRPFSACGAAVWDDLTALYRRWLTKRPALSDETAFRRAMGRDLTGMGTLVLAHRCADDALVGAVTLLIHDRIGSYYAAFSERASDTGRVPTALACLAIEESHRQGADLFDFVGVHDERFPDEATEWSGFTTFKGRFGGDDVYLPPAFRLMTP